MKSRFGTTSCRTLESVATKLGEIREDDDNTSIFIYPGYQFKYWMVDYKFSPSGKHLIMLVSAFAVMSIR